MPLYEEDHGILFPVFYWLREIRFQISYRIHDWWIKFVLGISVRSVKKCILEGTTKIFVLKNVIETGFHSKFYGVKYENYKIPNRLVWRILICSGRDSDENRSQLCYLTVHQRQNHRESKENIRRLKDSGCLYARCQKQRGEKMNKLIREASEALQKAENKLQYKEGQYWREQMIFHCFEAVFLILFAFVAERNKTLT